jgi:hypothetical protein
MNSQEPTTPPWILGQVNSPPLFLSPPTYFSTTRSEFVPGSSSESGEYSETIESIQLNEYFQPAEATESIASKESYHSTATSASFFTRISNRVDRMYRIANSQLRQPITPQLGFEEPDLNSTLMWQNPDERKQQRAPTPMNFGLRTPLFNQSDASDDEEDTGVGVGNRSPVITNPRDIRGKFGFRNPVNRQQNQNQ